MFHKSVKPADRGFRVDLWEKPLNLQTPPNARLPGVSRATVKSLSSSSGEALGRGWLVLTGHKIAAGGQPIGHRGQFPVLTKLN